MCGRYSRSYTWREVHAFSRAIDIQTPVENPDPAFNVAPTQPGWVIASDGDGKATARLMRWGLVPAWAKDSKIGYSTINARLETAATKPVFRSAWKARRCLIPASGYYEWPMVDGAKVPHFIHPTGDPVLMFAGLWERWHGNGEPVETYTIITMDAVGGLLDIHNRTPLMLPPEVLRDWMEGDADQATAIAHASPVPDLAWHAVGKAVGNVRSQGPHLIERVGS